MAMPAQPTVIRTVPALISSRLLVLIGYRSGFVSATLCLALCAASLAIPARLDAQQPSACRRPSPFDNLQSRVESWIASEDSLHVAFRRGYQLPHLPPDSVLIVTDERICERAAQAYYRGHIGPRPLEGVEVLRVGDMYIIYGAKRSGEWGSLEFYTRDFEYVGGILG